jgi:hypothetical protein
MDWMPARRVGGQRNHAVGKFYVPGVDPVLYDLGKERVGPEVPYKDLDQEGSISEEFYVGRRQEIEGLDLAQLEHGDDGAEHHRKDD